jgi:hypothetical protein
MQLGSRPSWQIAVDRWNQAYDWALWMRAAQRIDVPAGGLVPGPLLVEPLPEPSATPPGTDLGAGWRHWWQSLVRMPRWRPDQLSGPPPQLAYLPPDFPGLAQWPGLQRIAVDRWREAHDWHTARKAAGLDRFQPEPRESRLVLQIERELGRRLPAFDLEFILLPVRDGEIREVTPTRYLVPEAVYDSPQWTDRLRPLVLRLAT